MHSAATWRVVVLNSQLVCHTTLLPHQGVLALLAFTTNFKYSEYFYNKYLHTLDRKSMLNINFVLFCWILPSIPPPPAVIT